MAAVFLLGRLMNMHIKSGENITWHLVYGRLQAHGFGIVFTWNFIVMIIINDYDSDSLMMVLNSPSVRPNNFLVNLLFSHTT